jgi:hypothetical protein
MAYVRVVAALSLVQKESVSRLQESESFQEQSAYILKHSICIREPSSSLFRTFPSSSAQTLEAAAYDVIPIPFARLIVFIKSSCVSS